MEGDSLSLSSSSDLASRKVLQEVFEITVTTETAKIGKAIVGRRKRRVTIVTATSSIEENQQVMEENNNQNVLTRQLSKMLVNEEIPETDATATNLKWGFLKIGFSLLVAKLASFLFNNNDIDVGTSELERSVYASTTHSAQASGYTVTQTAVQAQIVK